MKLTEKPDFIERPSMHYVYVEKIGPFMETAQKAWQMLHEQIPALTQISKVTGFMAIFQMEPQMIYRAGESSGGL